MTYVCFAAAVMTAGYLLAVRIAKRHGLSIRTGSAGMLLLAAALGTAYCTKSFSCAIVAATCAVAAVTDLSSGYVFDAIVVPAIAATLVIQMLHGGLMQALAGVCVSGGVPLLLFACTRGAGIGLGDVKLGACIGAGLGVAASVTALQIAFVTGALAALFLLIVRRAPRRTAMAFAPYLAAGMFAAGVMHPGR